MAFCLFHIWVSGISDISEVFSAVIFELIAQVLIAELPGVAIGLGIRYLVRKVKARKQPIPA